MQQESTSLWPESRTTAGIVIACIYVPFVVLTAALYSARAGAAVAIRSRFPALSLVSALWGVAFFLAICAQQIVGEPSFPSWVALWTSHLIPPIYAFPYILRSWMIFAAYVRQRHVAGIDSSTAGFFTRKLSPFVLESRWLSGTKFVCSIWAWVFFIHVASTVAFNMARACYRGDPSAKPCLFFDEIWLFLPMLAVYCAAVLLGARLLWEVREDYFIRAELFTCFFSWGIFAGTYFVLRLLRSFDKMNRVFPISWVMSLWPLSTYVITIAAPGFWFLRKFGTAKSTLKTARRQKSVARAAQKLRNSQPVTSHPAPLPEEAKSQQESASADASPPSQPDHPQAGSSRQSPPDPQADLHAQAEAVELDTISAETDSSRSSRRWSLDDDMILFLSDESNRKDFKRFLAHRFSSESILFFEDCEARRKNPDSEARARMATNIISDFLEDGSPLQLSVGRDNRAKYSQLDFSALTDHKLFDPIERFVVAQLELEHWADFLQMNPQPTADAPPQVTTTTTTTTTTTAPV